MRRALVFLGLWLGIVSSAFALFFTPPPFPIVSGNWSPIIDLGAAYGGNGSSVITLSGITVPAGALIITCASETATGTNGGITDGSNTYNVAKLELMNNSATIGFTAISYAYNVAALSLATLTFTKQSSIHQAALAAFYSSFGLMNSGVLDTATTAGAFGISASPSVTSATTAGQSGELFVGCSGNRSSLAFTQDSTNGWASPFDPAGASLPTSVLQGGGNLVNAGTGTKTYAPTLGSSSSWADAIVSFKHR